MKSGIGFAAVLLTTFLISIGSWFVLSNKEYFEDYFRVKQQKLKLRSEESVDSLVAKIKQDSIYIDSLKGRTTILEFNLKNSNEANVYWKKSMEATIDNYEAILKRNNIQDETGENY